MMMPHSDERRPYHQNNEEERQDQAPNLRMFRQF